ncbi:MAG: hydrogenase maturation protease [Desulfobacca sp.]|uniref:hydrogenase maturation protease n=1 Tax=Desulfobacca sp. TaxID=2067990 RepID=UPI00404A8FCC
MHNLANQPCTIAPGVEPTAASVLVCGCGNTLMGDDGFGPAVIEELLAQHRFPPAVRVEDVGTSIRDLLFDLLLAPHRPQKILIIDAARQPGRQPGELFELAVDQIAAEKVNDFSVHHFPSLNLLQELAASGGVEVRLLTVQIEQIPEEIQPGLSPAVAAAIPAACQWVLAQIGGSA